MISLIFFTCLTSFVHSGLITHDFGGDGDYEKATSYQNIHMEHFHAVPTFIKKEYKHLLDHPLPAGKSSSKVEIHHGGKHDHGYAIVDTHNNAHGSGSDGGHDGGHEGSSLGGQESAGFGGHESSGHLVAQAVANAALSHGASGGYQVHDQNEELLQHQIAQGAQSHDNLHLQAAAALSHGGSSLGHGEASLSHGGASLGHYQAAVGGHQGYESAVASAALQFQNSGYDGHGH